MKRSGESGNIFFTLFGAIALVGVVGVATSTLLRGPVGTVLTLNQRAKVESQLQIARKLTALDAAQAQTNCESPAETEYMEPLDPDLLMPGCNTLITGGGCLPSTVGAAKTDPWGTLIGYCGWDHGPNNTGCGDLLVGVNGSSDTVLAVISAGPDRAFQTTCVDAVDADVNGAADNDVVVEAGDDIIFEWTYEEASEGLGGGLWSLKSGDPDAITTNKDVEFASGTTASFDNVTADFGAGSQLDLSGGGLFNLPDETVLQNGDCTVANRGVLRRQTSGGTAEALEICDGTTWQPVVGAGGTAAGGANGNIQFNSGGVLDGDNALTWNAGTNALGVTGTAGISGNATVGGTLGVTGATTLGSTLGVTGVATLSNNATVGGTMGVTGATTLSSTLGVTGVATLSNNATVGGTMGVTGATTLSSTLGVTGATTLGSTLGVTGASTLGSTLSVAGAVSDPDSDVVIGDGLNATGAVDFDSTLNVDGATVLQTTLNAKGAVDFDSTLNLDGIMLFGPTAQVEGGACATAGQVTFDAVNDELLLCSSVAGSKWVTIGTSGGGGGGAGATTVWERSGTVIRTKSPAVNSTDDFVFGSPQLADDGDANHDNRMFFDKSKGAFRAGGVPSTQWDDASVGDYSTSMGITTTANGWGSVAIGDTIIASGIDSIALGRRVRAGNGTAGNGLGDGSMALGLIDDAVTITTASQVTGIQSMGIFMGDQDGLVMSAANTMGLFGGRMVIDPNVPATQLDVSTGAQQLELDVTGDIGAVNYCDDSGNNCFTASDVSGGTIGAPGNDREVVFVSGTTLDTHPNFVFTSAGRLGIGTAAPTSPLDVVGNIYATAWVGGGGVEVGNQGNAATPALNMIGNGSAGLFIPAADSLAVATGGAERIRVDANGNVGIGDTTPNSGTGGQLKLDVEGPVGGTKYCDEAGNNCFTAASVGTADAYGADGVIQFASAGLLWGNSNFVFTSTGRLGVGTSAPGYPLSVNGRIETKGGMLFNQGSAWSDNLIYVGSDSVGPVDASFGFFVGGVGSSSNGHGAYFLARGNTFSNIGNQRGNMYFTAGNPVGPASSEGSLNFVTGSEQLRMIINKDGNVGINDPTPDSGTGGQLLLDVEGPVGGTKYCDEAGNNCFTAASVGAASAPDRGVQFNSGGAFAADANFVYTSTGRLGIGDSNPQFGLSLVGDFQFGNGFDTGYLRAGTDYIGLGRNSNGLDLAIDQGTGNVGIGTTSPSALLHIKKATDNYAETLIVEGDGEPAVSIQSSSANGSFNPIFWTSRSRGSRAAKTIVSSGDSLFELQAQGYDGSANRDAAYIEVAVDGTPGASDMPGRIEFHTQADGAGGLLENSTPELIIKNNGAVGIGMASPASKFVVAPPTSAAVAGAATITADACGTIKQIYAGAIGTTTGNVTTNTTDTFTAPTASYAGCCMDVVNIDSGDTVTLDQNAKFLTGAGSDIALAPSKAVRVCSDGTSWYQAAAVSSVAAGGSSDIDSLSDAYADYTTLNNLIMGRASATALAAGAQRNVFIGELAGATTANSTATTDSNTAVGYQSLSSLTSGDQNTAVGRNALSDTTSGSWNVAVGNQTLQENTGNGNVAIGAVALYSNVAKSESTAIGHNAMLYADDTATGAVTYNTAVGAYALRGSTTAANNTGTNNTAVGHSSLDANTSGASNTALGVDSLGANQDGSWNVAIGHSALYRNVGGGRNTAVGEGALYSGVNNTDDNTAIGKSALELVNGSDFNVALGSRAGDSITTGASNILIGYDADTPANNTSNHLNIGGTIFGDVSTDNVRIGGSGVVSAGPFIANPPTSAAVAGAATIAADACGTIKQIYAGAIGTTTGNVTTNTTDTFTAPTASYAGCCMDVVNIDSGDTVTLDSNAKFLTGAGSDIALAPSKAVRVCSDGTSWYQAAAVSSVAAGGSVALSSITAATTDATISSGANNIAWNWQLTGAETGMVFGETAASSGGTIGASGNQFVMKVSTLATSTATPLVVTNLGTANSFRVNDETGDADTTPFVVTSNGGVGIGTTSPDDGAKPHKVGIEDDATFGGFHDDVGQLQIRGTLGAANNFKQLTLGVETTVATNYAWIQSSLNGTGSRALALNPDGGNVGVGTSSPASKFVVAPPTSAAVAGAATIAADACGTIKQIYAGAIGTTTGNVTTNTTNTFTAPTASYAGCCMDVVNIDSGDTVTLDSNAKFLTGAGSDIALAPSKAVRVCSDGTSWYQAATVSSGVVGSPAGANTQVQYNNAGVMGASASFTWDESSGLLNVGSGNSAFGYGFIGRSDHGLYREANTNNLYMSALDDLRINIDSNSNSSGASFSIATDVNAVTGGTQLLTVLDTGSVGIGTSSPASKFVVAPPASAAVAAAATIAADACGTIKQITSTGNVTTNTTNTFTAPTASYAGCCMDVVNVDTADTITLDSNAKFLTGAGSDIALAPNKAVRVCSDGTNWYQAAAVSSVAAGGSVALSSITAAAATNTINNTNYAQEWQWSTLAGATGLKLSSTSTAAASNAQKLFEIALSGANSTATQTTYGTYISNTHTGATSTNVGLYATASGGTDNYAAQFAGVDGSSTPAVLVSAGSLRVDGQDFNGYSIYLGASNGAIFGSDAGQFSASTNMRIAAGDGDLTLTANTSSGSGNILFKTVSDSEKVRITAAGNVGIGTSSPASKFVVAPPASAAVAAAATIAADACGTIKQITSTGNVTTNTTDTFTAPTASYAGCCMSVINVDTADTITLDSNAKFFTGSGSDIALAPGKAVPVCSDGTSWYQAGGVSSLTSASVAFNGLTAAGGTNTINNATYAQEWQWNTLAGATGLKLSSTSTAAASNAQKLFEIALSGANGTAAQTTYGAYITNTHTGTTSTNVGLFLGASGGATDNIALQLDGDTAAQKIAMARETTAATAGRDLTISAGGAKSGGTDLAGGNLTLSSGTSTGGSGSYVSFLVPLSTGGNGTTDRAPSEHFRMGSQGLMLQSSTNTASKSIGFNTLYSGGSNVYWDTDSAFEFYHDYGNDLLTFNAAASGTAGNPITFTPAIKINTVGSVAIGSSQTTLAAKFVVAPPTSEAIAGAAVITANACGTIKQITSTGNVTTNTTNTFTAPTASYAGCCMDVINVDTADTITLDSNAKFLTGTGSDIALAANKSVRVCSDGTSWYQAAAVSSVAAGGTTTFVSLSDVPSSYAGQSKKYLRVNTGETAVEFTNEIIAESVSGLSLPTGMTLDNLSDVTASGAATSDGISYNGSAWVLNSASTGAFLLPSGTAAQRPTAANGMMRYKTDTTIGFEVREAGAWVAMGAAASDIRLKTDLQKLDSKDVLARLDQVQGYSYRLKEDGEGVKRYGVIAQELENVFPELVNSSSDPKEMKSVRYMEFTALLIEASKELKAENDNLKAEVDDMKTKLASIDDLRRDVAGLKAHTGYGINKAQLGAGIIFGMAGGGFIFFLIGVTLRNRKRNSAG